MQRQKLDVLSPIPGEQYRVYMPHDQPPKEMEATGEHDPQRGWKMRDTVSGTTEWVRGELVATRLR